MIDSDSELMQSLDESGSDLLNEFKDKKQKKNGASIANNQTRVKLTEKLNSVRKSGNCGMIKRLETKLSHHVGRYRHGDSDDQDIMYWEKQSSRSVADSDVASSHHYRPSHPSSRSGSQGRREMSGRPRTVGHAS